MPSLNSDTSVDILINTKSDKKGLEDASDGLSKLKHGFESAVGPSKVLAAGIVAVGAAAVIFGKQSVDAYFAATEAGVKLRTNMLNVKGATLENVTSLSRLASQLQSVGVIEDDVIKAGMSQLATFNLQGKTIEKLTPKITDMVAQLKGHNATAEDMVGINNLVGKVMTGNVGALSRYGVTLDDNQKKVLQNGNETERASMLTQVLAQNYGKVNEQLRNTPQGKITGLKNAFGDLQETVGELIVEVATPLMDAFSGWIASMEEAGGILEWINKVFNENKQTVAIVAGAIMMALVPALAAGAVAMWSFFAPILPFIAAGALLGYMLNNVAEGMGGWSVMITTTKNSIMGIWNVISAMLMPSLKALWNTIATQLLPSLKQLWWAIEPVLLPALKILAVIIGVSLVASMWIWINVVRVVIVVLTGMIHYIRAVINAYMDLFNWMGGIAGRIGGALSGVYNALTSPFSRAFDWISQLPARIVNSVGNIGNLLRQRLGDWDIPGPLGKVRDVIPGFATGVRNFSGGMALVGERGPELVNLPSGSDVFTNSQSKGMMGNVTNKREISIGNIYLGSADAVKEFYEQLDNDTLLSGKGLTPVRGGM